ncbi:hypothetical protein M9Y53_24500 [Klebsiella pneumoniae]|nr:hypothetical protein [Klebsiella pneumoniae]MCL8337289.1 hypothetical protein [Klebsiella pneumoniae]
MLSGLLSHPVCISTDINIINTFIGCRIRTHTYAYHFAYHSGLD